MSATQPTPETLLSHAGFVRRLAQSLLSDAHLAEDVSQNALLAALNSGPRSGRSLRPWLARVTRNFAAHSVRSRGRSKARELDRPEPVGAPGPQEIIEREQVRSRVVHAVLGLNEIYRAPILLRFYEDLSADEIAGRLQIPLGTVRTRLRRGQELLRTRLQGDGPGLGAVAPAWRLSGATPPATGALAPLLWATGMAKLAALCLVAGTLGVLWLQSGPSRPVPQEIGLAPLLESQGELEPHAQGVLPPQARQFAVKDPEASANQPFAPAQDADPQAPVARGSLVLRFVDPNRGALTLASGSLTLTANGLPDQLITIADQTQLTVDLQRGLEYTLTVQTPGRDHYAQTVTLHEGDPSPESIVLWPTDWIAIRVRTPRGEDFSTLAELFQIEPRRLFVHAFQSEVRLQPPANGSHSEATDDSLAIFHQPPSWHAWSLPGGFIGSLELKTHPPLWVGLSLYGVTLDWKPLNAGQRVLDFEVDAGAFEERFASVRARLIERAGGSGVRDVRVTLKAETSAYRRDEHTESAPDDRGELHLRRIVPGRYGLTLECGGSLFQSWLELKAGEDLDLGEILMQPGAGIPLQVLDEEGEAVVGYVEIAPYQRGAKVEDLYHPNLHRKTQPDGTYMLPLPGSPSIVRVTQVPRSRNGIGNRRTPNVLIDPDHPPLETLVITAKPRVEVRVAGLPDQEGQVQLVDNQGLIVFTEEWIDAPWSAYLVPGSYEARLLGPAGELLANSGFELVEQPIELRLP